MGNIGYTVYDVSLYLTVHDIGIFECSRIFVTLINITYCYPILLNISCV